MELTNPSNLPDPSEIDHMEEPIVTAEIMVTSEYVGAIMGIMPGTPGRVSWNGVY